MPPIDDKVVAASFESSKFEAGVQNTLAAIDKLKSALKFDGAGKGFDDINSASKRVDISHIGKNVDEINSKLVLLSVAAVAVFADIARSAAASAETFIKSFTITPILDGFKEYATTLNSVQTILANTQASGATLGDVNAALKNLNDYSDKTIYNFGQMAKNIGTFTAAGVDLDTSTQAIKGIANLAALSGSNADQAATAMYQLSQAISSGQVHLQDWNSVVNAGMGGTVFQRALATTAQNMGKIKEGELKLIGPMKNVSIAGESFRQSLSKPGKESWLTSDVLTTTLKQFTGDLTNAQLKSQGFTDAQIKAIQITAQTAMHAATEVKTLKQVIDVARETAGSGWAQTWQLIFGNFGEAKTTFTELSNAVNGIINRSSDARNKVLGDWNKLGGRTLLIDSIKEAFVNLGMALKPIKEAFREIFPAKTGADLFAMTVKFKQFVDLLKPGPETIANLKRTFAGLFAVLDIGKQIIGGIFTVFGKLFGSVGEGSGGFLNFTGNIGDFLVKVDEALKKGNRLHNFFAHLGEVLAAPIELLKAIAQALGDLFSGFSPGGFFKQIGGLNRSLTPFQKIMKAVSKIWDHFIDSVANSGNILRPALEAIVKFIQGIGPAIGKGATDMNFDAILDVLKIGLLGGFLKFFLDFKRQITGGFLGTGGILGNISGSFGALQGSLKGMQRNLNAKALKELAIAIALLALSVVALSLVDPAKLTGAVTALGFMFAELLIAMKVMDSISKGLGFAKLPFIAASLILLATAIDILVIAVIALSRLSWEQLLKGLGAVGILLGVISAAVIPLSANSSGMVRAGIGITAIAIALNLLAIAVKTFGDMSWTELGKGLIGVGVGLGILVAGVNAIPSGMVLKGVGLIAVVVALKLLADVVQKFGGMDWIIMAKGMAGIGAGLVIIAAAMHLMPKNMILIALGLIGITTALMGVAKVVQVMGEMSVKEMAKGLIGLGGALAILALGLNAMAGTAKGATAVAIAAGGLALLAPAIVLLGKQSVGNLAKGLGAIAIGLVIIGRAAASVGPAVPALLGFGAALFLIGAGLALAGAGIALLGIGLSSIAIAGPAALGILVAALRDLMALIPEFVHDLVLGLLEMVKVFADTAPQFVDAIIKILDSLLDAVIKSAPKIAKAFEALLVVAIKVLHDNEGKIIQAGFNLIIALLQGLKNNINQIAILAVDIISRFLTAIANNISKIISGGTQIIVAFLKGIGDSMAAVVTAGISIITKFLGAIADNLGKVVTAGLSILTKFLGAIASGVKDVIQAGTDIIVNIITGIGNASKRIIKAGADSIILFVNSFGEQTIRVVNAINEAILNFLASLTASITTYAPQYRVQGARLGFAIADGMTLGLLGKSVDLYKTARGVASKTLGIIGGLFKSKSPSRVMFDLGENIILGWANGLDSKAPKVYASAKSVSNELIKTFKDIFQITSPSKVMHDIGQAVGQGFAQGVRGSSDDIRSAFEDMNSKLTDEMVNARETIASEQDKLDQLRKDTLEKQDKLNKLRADKKPDKDAIKNALQDIADSAAAIKEVQAVIQLNEDVLARTTAGHIALTKTLRDEKGELVKLANEYDDVSQRLKDKITILENLNTARADLVKGLKESFGALPALDETKSSDIIKARTALADEQANLNKVLGDNESSAKDITSAQTSVAEAQAALAEILKGKTLDSTGNSVDQLATYEDALKHQTDAVGAYNATLVQLRKLGLDDATYQKLLAEGTADQEFANQLLAGGKTGVAALNILDKQLQKASSTLAVNAGNSLKQAGIDAAQGIVNGLEERKDAIRTKMGEIARMMVRTLRNALKSKSPSQEFAEIGRFSMEGLAQGFSNSSKIVTNAIEVVANDALTTLQRSMRNMSDIVTNELNTDPVITPILDLTKVRDQTQELAALTNVIPITAATSYGQALMISSQETAAKTELEKAVSSGTSVKFEQNNYSPEALTEIEIYRQTRNQLSQLKAALDIK